mgnify:CR=1 FL=1
MRVYGDVAKQEFLILGDNGSEIIDDAYVIITHDTKGYSILGVAFSAPTRLNDTITEATSKVIGVRLMCPLAAN